MTCSSEGAPSRHRERDLTFLKVIDEINKLKLEFAEAQSQFFQRLHFIYTRSGGNNVNNVFNSDHGNGNGEVDIPKFITAKGWMKWDSEETQRQSTLCWADAEKLFVLSRMGSDGICGRSSTVISARGNWAQLQRHRRRPDARDQRLDARLRAVRA